MDEAVARRVIWMGFHAQRRFQVFKSTTEPEIPQQHDVAKGSTKLYEG